MHERWRDVIGYERLYQVSDQGRVKSLARIDLIGRNIRDRVMRPGRQSAGYRSVVLAREGKRITYLVHRLVLEAFVGPCPEGMECRHFPNLCRTNNRLENLQWGTREEQAVDRRVHETGNVKLTESDIQAILAASGTQREVATRFRINQSQVSRIKRGKIWKHTIRRFSSA